MANLDKAHQRLRESRSCDHALAIVLSLTPEPSAHPCPLDQCYGLVSAGPVSAVEPSPMFNTSAMDGYAVRAADTNDALERAPISLRIEGSVAAGRVAPSLGRAGASIRVMTGAPCPDGADAVIPIEHVRLVDGQVIITRPVVPGSNIRIQGEDIQPGDLLIAHGDHLGPARIALLASQGIQHVSVYPAPRVALFVTGDELAEGGADPEGASIRDSNSLMLAALVRSMGAEVVASTRIGDDPAGLLVAVRDSIRREVDLVVTVGGASAGDRDVVSDLVSLGVELELMDVRMKPGRPLACGLVDGTPLIGLPGNPAAAFVSALQFVHPAIGKLRGVQYPVWPECTATVTTTISNPGGRRNFVRVILDQADGIVMATPAGPQNAANLMTLSRADGLLVVPESLEQVNPGDLLTIQLFPGSEFGTGSYLPHM